MQRTHAETIRGLYLGYLRRLFQHRYRGPELPDDDSGRGDLFDLLVVASLAQTDPRKKMRNAIEVYSPWVEASEAEHLIDTVNRMPLGERWRHLKLLGDRQRVTNEERENLGLWLFKPTDITHAALAEQRKKKERDRKRRRRHQLGHLPRAQYLAVSKSRLKPWEAEGISRRTWERRRAKAEAEQKRLH